MPKSNAYIMGYAAAVCLVASLLLAGTTAALKSRQDREVELDRKFNVLKAFQVSVMEGRKRISGDRIEKIYTDHIREVILDAASGAVIEGRTSRDFRRSELEARKVLPLFKWEENGRFTKVAFPVFGKGLWSTIYGYLALDGDLATILGVTFYRHGETPGLGGEVEKDWFQKQFEGKKIYRNGAIESIRVVKGKAQAENEVDGITGATLTGNGVTEFLDRDIRAYETYLKTLRDAAEKG